MSISKPWPLQGMTLHLALLWDAEARLIVPRKRHISFAHWKKPMEETNKGLPKSSIVKAALFLD